MSERLERLPVNDQDFRAVEKWLESMAEQGQYLTETVGKWWYFKNGEPKHVRYRLDILEERERNRSGGRPDPQKIGDYEAMGWKYMATFRGRYHIFMSEDPSAPELHTDQALEDIQMNVHRRRLRESVVLSVLGASIFSINMRNLGAEYRGCPVQMILSPSFPFMAVAGVLILFLMGNYFYELLAFKRFQAQDGGDISSVARAQKRKKWQGIVSLAAILAAVVLLFRSCSVGEPIEQKIQYGGVFPALEFLGDGAAKEGAEEGDIFYDENPLLKEAYTVSQERETDDGRTIALQAKYFNLRASFLAEPLYEELLSGEGGAAAFDPVSAPGFESYLIKREQDGQVLAARAGNQVLVMTYTGSADLEEIPETVLALMEHREK